MIKKISNFIIPVIVVFVFIAVFFSVRSLGINRLQAYFSDFLFSDEFKDDVPLSQFNYERLNSTEKKAYICIFEKIKKHPEYIKIPYLTNDEFRNVYFAVKNDNPDVLCFPDSCDMLTFFSANFIRIDYSSDVSECNKMMIELNLKADEIVESFDTENQYAKELYCHDYIVNLCSYDEDAQNGSNAYGCLVEKTAYCSGYSRAMMLLLIKSGIECSLVSGIADAQDGSQQSHMWNVVWIDSEPYYLDVTWNDQDDIGNVISHLFFNITTDDISLTHTDISVDIECTSDKANYFVREKLLLDSFNEYDIDTIAARLNHNISKEMLYVEFRFTDSVLYDKAKKEMFESTDARSAFYRLIGELSDDSREVIDVSHVNAVTEKEQNYVRLMFDKK